jgi:hypothetical protein
MIPASQVYLGMLLFLGVSMLMLGNNLWKMEQVRIKQARVRPRKERHKARQIPSGSPLSFLMVLAGGTLSATSALVLAINITMG